MNFLKKYRIGYVSYDEDLSHAVDRRRFGFYAKSRKINFEVANKNNDYDIVVLSQAADYSYWLKNKNPRTKYIFDFIDSYLDVSPFEIKGLARGASKYFFGQSKYLRPNYWNTLREMCAASDVVICVTDEQQKAIEQYCQNVYQILDFHDEVLTTQKENYRKGSVFNIVWEGFASNLYPFKQIERVLKKIDTEKRLALHLITEEKYFRFLNSYGKVETSEKIKRIFNNSYVYKWSLDTYSTISVKSDMAIIPIDLNYPLMKGKPENKLTSFLKMGLPTLTSATPSHIRFQQKSGLDIVCHNESEWSEKLARLINDDSYRESLGRNARKYVSEEYNSDKLIEKWDEMFIKHFS